MELLQLKYFYETAKSLHVTNTAKKLHVAQPSLTQTIHRLEKELGVKLFERSGRNIILTEYGEFLKHELEPVINTVDEIPTKIAEMAELNKNNIKVNLLAASTVVINALIDFEEENPNARFKIVQGRESDSADITVFTEPVYKNKHEGGTFVFTEQIFLAVPDRSEYKNLDKISLEDVKNKNFISLAGSKQLRQICDRYCMQAGFTPNIIFESDSLPAVRNMIRANLGIGFWPQHTWGETSSGHVKFLPISFPKCRRDIIIKKNINFHKGNYQAVEKFYEFLVETFRNL